MGRAMFSSSLFSGITPILFSGCDILGQKDYERANRTAMNGILLEVMSGLVFTLLGLTCARMFFQA